MAELLTRPVKAFLLFALVGCLTACGSATGEDNQTVPPPTTPEQKATASPDNPDSAVLADFNARLDNYITLQRDLAEDAPLEESENTAEIIARQELLASKIRNIRKDAKQGDIFTPQVAAMFRRLMNPDLKGAEGREVKEQIVDDAPVTAGFPLKVNASYPPKEPLSTVPANLLEKLPSLPKDVDYRIIGGKHLILRDVDAHIVVDYIPNAIR